MAKIIPIDESRFQGEVKDLPLLAYWDGVIRHAIRHSNLLILPAAMLQLPVAYREAIASGRLQEVPPLARGFVARNIEDLVAHERQGAGPR